ncbi:MAG: MEDS domain-containing protein [Mycobacteriales bacterium]
MANARDAVRHDEDHAGQRRASCLEQARAQGPWAWQPLHRSPVPARRGAGHAVHFAVSDADLVTRLAAYVADGLDRGEVCVVLATEDHRAGMRQWLAANALPPPPEGRLVEVDADALLERLVRGGRLLPEVFSQLLASLPQERLRGGGLRAFGEVVSVLHQRGQLALALQLERLWDEAQRRHGFPLLCSYLDDGTSGADLVGPVCAVHTHLAAGPLARREATAL